MQNSRLRTVYRQRKWPLPALVRKIIALGRKIMVLGCQVFHYSVKCSKHGLRAFIDAVPLRLATQTFTMLMSCWQKLSELELRRIFDVCKWWANSNFACIYEEKYGSIHEATRAIRLLIVWKSWIYPQPRPGGLGRRFVLHFYTCSARTARFGLLYRNILFRKIFFQGLYPRCLPVHIDKTDFAGLRLCWRRLECFWRVRLYVKNCRWKRGGNVCHLKKCMR